MSICECWTALNRSLSARRAWIEIVDPDADTLTDDVVALRKESVDRNVNPMVSLNACRLVALRKESVDRNFCGVSLNYKEVLSLSARRAWIEIRKRDTPSHYPKSLSARRAWIEMLTLIPIC